MYGADCAMACALSLISFSLLAAFALGAGAAALCLLSSFLASPVVVVAAAAAPVLVAASVVLDLESAAFESFESFASFASAATGLTLGTVILASNTFRIASKNVKLEAASNDDVETRQKISRCGREGGTKTTTDLGTVWRRRAQT